jgi:hypothetical protein
LFSLLNKCSTPPDFPGNNFEEKFEDRASPATINDIEKLNMGLIPYPELPAKATNGQRKALELHNKILGFA